MPSLYILNVPEFMPLVDAAREKGTFDIKGPVGGYYRISIDGDFKIERKDTGLTEALWFGAFTAGYDGRELIIDSDQFWIGPYDDG